MIKSFRDLTVWQKSFDLVKDVYRLAGKLPSTERYGLCDQIRRCGVSIPSNIAEGSNRGTRKDFIQFLRIAYGSSAELETQLLLVNELYNENIDKEMIVLIEVQKMLSGLIASLSTKN